MSRRGTPSVRAMRAGGSPQASLSQIRGSLSAYSSLAGPEPVFGEVFEPLDRPRRRVGAGGPSATGVVCLVTGEDEPSCWPFCIRRVPGCHNLYYLQGALPTCVCL